MSALVARTMRAKSGLGRRFFTLRSPSSFPTSPAPRGPRSATAESGLLVPAHYRHGWLVGAEDTLNNSRIEAKFVNGGIGLDLNTGGINRLGVGNIIYVNAPGLTGNAINLNSTWNDVDNQIYLNGVLQSNPSYP
jgi:hypothetical protein